jgi:hypothetical protein
VSARFDSSDTRAASVRRAVIAAKSACAPRAADVVDAPAEVDWSSRESARCTTDRRASILERW